MPVRLHDFVGTAGHTLGRWKYVFLAARHWQPTWHAAKVYYKPTFVAAGAEIPRTFISRESKMTKRLAVQRPSIKIFFPISYGYMRMQEPRRSQEAVVAESVLANLGGTADVVHMRDKAAFQDCTFMNSSLQSGAAVMYAERMGATRLQLSLIHI